MNELLTILEREYANKEFDLKEILNKTPYKKSKLYDLLNELVKANKVVKITENKYKLTEPGNISIPKEIIALSENLKKIITRKFKFTALSVLLPFAHHTLYSLNYLIYVEKGSGEDFKEVISKLDPKLTVLFDPKKEDVLLMINEADKNRILIIRENAYFYGKEYGIAYPETAFIDLYFEVSRDKIPFMKTDIKEILKELVLKNLINYSRLMRYAHERKLTAEIKNILLELSKEVKLPEGGLNVLQKIS